MIPNPIKLTNQLFLSMTEHAELCINLQYWNLHNRNSLFHCRLPNSNHFNEIRPHRLRAGRRNARDFLPLHAEGRLRGHQVRCVVEGWCQRK